MRRAICAAADPAFPSPQWQAISLTVIEKVQIAAAILGSLFLIASISWLIWSTFSPSAKWQRQDLLFQICYGMYGFMDVVCIGRAGGSSLWGAGGRTPVRQQDPTLWEVSPEKAPAASCACEPRRGQWLRSEGQVGRGGAGA